MKSSEIRNTFVNYFKKHEHALISSSSLIPENDPTLLFANAGMNQFKNLFLGLEKKDYTRAVSVQKCVRAGGKHNDLENVGFTARHHTFFEMLGNFSFGDYFKKDAIHFAWELLTKELQIPKEKLYVTVFETDDEAADIWHKQEGVDRGRIFRFGEKDNFWRMGDTGPCGPCTEIFYDHGPRAGKEADPYKGILAGEDRFVEIWNLVFMQFFEKAPGQMEPLPKPSVDTGSGLERVVAALQGKFNNYDTDLFSPMIETACRKSGVEYVHDLDILAKHAEIRERTAALRVMADHCRATGFLLADGALPSNEGRGYVLRRIMRRAIRFGRKLNSTTSLLPDMVESLIPHMGEFYPELKERREHILSVVRDEENRFLHTLDQGTQILQDEIQRARRVGQNMLTGETVFKLYDTFGFPVDLTRLMAEEQSMVVDEKSFDEAMEKSRNKAKSSWKGKGLQADEAHLIGFAQNCFNKAKATSFLGYDGLTNSAKIIGLSNGNQEVSFLLAGQTGFVVLDKTSFYAEGGGQVGDHGKLWTSNGTELEVEVHLCTKQSEVFIHHVSLMAGKLEVGQKVEAEVTTEGRRATAANHSATHLMHAALRKVLGTHVTQAGSLVDPTRLRFDFTHNKALSSEELEKIENLVNSQIELALPVRADVMGHKEALAQGAMALFGEKYGENVRVLKMGDFSCELCGGTHVENTASIRLFKIVSEGGVSAGVRRIEGVTGVRAFSLLNKGYLEAMGARHSVGMNETWEKYLDPEIATKTLVEWIEESRNQIKNLEKEIKKLKGSQVDLNKVIAEAHVFSVGENQGRLVWLDCDLEDRDVLAQVADQLKNKIQSGIVAVIGKGDSSHPVVVSVTSQWTKTWSAGNILKVLAQSMGGKGGGRPDFAQGAVPDRAHIKEAKAQVQSMIQSSGKI